MWTLSGLGLVYVLLPNSHHSVLAGAPLSLAGAAGLVLAVSVAALCADSRGVRVAVGALALALLVRATFLVALPPRGFSGEYFLNDAFAGSPTRYLDRRIDFDPSTFRREFLTDFRFYREAHPERLPFSVRWHGWIALPETAAISVDVSASEPATVTADGRPADATFAAGTHELVIAYVRRTETAPALRVTIARSAEPPGDPPVVFAKPVSATVARLADAYAAVSIALDLVVLFALAFSVAGALANTIHDSRRPSWVPPFAMVAFGVIVFWFALGALRLGPSWSQMEFLDPGDDWQHYQAMARRIAAGDIANGTSRTSAGTFAYPYFLALLHLVFGDRTRPLYFAQELMLGLTCVCLGLLGRRLFGERQGVFVALTATMVGVLDVHRWYVTRLLSENLVLLAIPVAFLAVDTYVMRPAPKTAAVASVVLGLTALVRANLLPFLGVTVLILASGALSDSRTPPRARPPIPLILLIGFAATYALLPLRDALVTGSWGLIPVNASYAYTQRPDYFFPLLSKSWIAPIRGIVLPNIAFILGYPKLVTVANVIRPHWLLLALAYGAYLVWGRPWRFTPTLRIVHLFIAMYLVFLLVTKDINAYGFRFMLPFTMFLALFVPGGLTAWWTRMTRASRISSR